MSHSIGYSSLGASHQPTLRPIRTQGDQPGPFWCAAIDTRWSKTMKNQVVAAALVSGPGVRRTWRFYSQTYRDS
jgi:hypothetical protein